MDSDDNPVMPLAAQILRAAASTIEHPSPALAFDYAPTLTAVSEFAYAYRAARLARP